jgi:hypothetical protein
MATQAVTDPSSDAPPPAERKAARKQPRPARAAYLAQRRERAVERDARRYELARELASDARIEIPKDKGFVVVPPGGVRGAEAVMQAANDAIDAIGAEGLLEIASADTAKTYLANRFVQSEEIDLDSVYLQFALSTEVLAPVTAYLGLVPVLYEFDVWYSMPQPDAPQASQLWHLDHDDESQVKVWVHCSDVGPKSGPLTAVEADVSAEFAARIGYDVGKGYRVPDEKVQELVPPEAITPLEGPRGTTAFVDTSRCFHFGSRLASDAEPRRMVYFAYITPYSFNYGDHRAEARYSAVGAGALDELTRLVLGAD